MNGKKRFLDILVQVPVMVGFLALCGLVSYLIIMLLSWIAGLNGLEGMGRTVLVGIFVVFGLSLCFYATLMYMQKIGSNDYSFLKENGVDVSKAKPALYLAGACFIIALCIYGLIMYLFTRFDWYFFQGPMAYITMALNVRWGTGLTTQYVSFWCKFAGFAVQAMILFPAMIMGYDRGFKARQIKHD